MAVNLTNANAALKTYYLDAVAEQLDKGINPFYAAIAKSENDVWGKEVKKLVAYGVNGGIGAGAEDGELPEASGNLYKEFTATLKNLYGTIEISDKAVRASANNAGAFVNLLTAEMEGLLKSAKFNFGRMLFGDGSGILASVKSITAGKVTVDTAKLLAENMRVEFLDSDGDPFDPPVIRRITGVERDTNVLTLDGTMLTSTGVPEGSLVSLYGSSDRELTGLKALFAGTSLYGLPKSSNPWLKPYDSNIGGELEEMDIQTAIDKIEENSGGTVNMILCSWGVRRSVQELFASKGVRLDNAELTGGYRAITYNGIPIVADRFCDNGTMYLLNTNDFTLHQLGDWQWLEGDDGSVLHQVPGKPVYTATLVKYAELLCERPCGQGRLTGITES